MPKISIDARAIDYYLQLSSDDVHGRRTYPEKNRRKTQNFFLALKKYWERDERHKTESNFNSFKRKFPWFFPFLKGDELRAMGELEGREFT